LPTRKSGHTGAVRVHGDARLKFKTGAPTFRVGVPDAGLRDTGCRKIFAAHQADRNSPSPARLKVLRRPSPITNSPNARRSRGQPAGPLPDIRVPAAGFAKAPAGLVLASAITDGLVLNRAIQAPPDQAGPDCRSPDWCPLLPSSDARRRRAEEMCVADGSRAAESHWRGGC
jgi:hypothetical protein